MQIMDFKLKENEELVAKTQGTVKEMSDIDPTKLAAAERSPTHSPRNSTAETPTQEGKHNEAVKSK